MVREQIRANFGPYTINQFRLHLFAFIRVHSRLSFSGRQQLAIVSSKQQIQ
jgi:hypothetical protein